MGTAMPTQAGAPLTQRQILRVFTGLMTGLSLAALDGTIVNTALPTIVGDIGGLEHYAWIGTAYLLTSTAATPLFGKLSDLYGRRLLFQAAIIIFVVGSLLCGISQNLTQLVLARGFQGIGGGGLMAMAFVIVGDVVPPRERGRYVGLFTSVFALASVIGPLIGGFFVDNIGWRWIFTINVPIGIVALVVTSSALRLPFVKHDHAIDWLGAALLVAAVSSIILMCSWGGSEYEWGSGEIIGMAVLSALLALAFVLWEGHASEPILPLRLFRNPVFAVITPMMMLLGSVMYGANAFLPLFFQAVEGVSATASGLLLLPLMAGVTISSIGTGRLTAINGRYKHWPIIGTASATIGLGVLTTLTADTSYAVSGTGMLLIGLGMGMTFPTATLAVQNAVEHRDLWVGTSSVTFFRSLGGAIGLAVFQAIFNANLSSNIDRTLLQTPAQIQALAEPTRSIVLEGLTEAISSLFVVAVPIMLIAFVLSWFVKEIPLRETSAMVGAIAEDGLDELDAAEAAAIAGAAISH
jgi:EmrB/QacA subfamily drug resistance transporter